MITLQPVFTELVAVLRPYGSELQIQRDTVTELYIDTRHIQKNKKPLFFGAVQLKKSYVAFHLMPVYVQPALLNGISPELKERMHGKSCFNFSEMTEPLLKELAALTKAGYVSYKEQGFVY